MEKLEEKPELGEGFLRKERAARESLLGQGSRTPRCTPTSSQRVPGCPAQGQLQSALQVRGRRRGVGAGGLSGCGAASLRGARLGAAGGTRLKVAPPPPPALFLLCSKTHWGNRGLSSILVVPPHPHSKKGGGKLGTHTKKSLCVLRKLHVASLGQDTMPYER